MQQHFIEGQGFPKHIADSSPRTWPSCDELSLNGQAPEAVPEKMRRFLRLFFQDWAEDIDVSIRSGNNFPTGCGVASSASGYAALVAALSQMTGCERFFSKAEWALWLTEWARLGSGSATRSALPQPLDPAFVSWDAERERGADTWHNHVACVEAHPDMLALNHLLAVVSNTEKKVSSSAGHMGAVTSPFQGVRVAGLPSRFESMKRALVENDFATLCFLAEEDALLMHAVMATADEPVRYMTSETLHIIEAFVRKRHQVGWRALWTLDAGPNVHFLVAPQHEQELRTFLQETSVRQGHEWELLSGGDVTGLKLGKGDN